MLENNLKNWQRSGRMAAVLLLAVSVTGCIVLPFGGGRGHRGHHYNSEVNAPNAASHGSASHRPGWRAPDAQRGGH